MGGGGECMGLWMAVIFYITLSNFNTPTSYSLLRRAIISDCSRNKALGVPYGVPNPDNWILSPLYQVWIWLIYIRHYYHISQKKEQCSEDASTLNCTHGLKYNTQNLVAYIVLFIHTKHYYTMFMGIQVTDLILFSLQHSNFLFLMFVHKIGKLFRFQVPH